MISMGASLFCRRSRLYRKLPWAVIIAAICLAFIAAALAQIDSLKKFGTTSDYLNKVKEAAFRSRETALKQNGYWLRRLQSVHLLGTPPADIITRAQRIDAVTPAAVQDVFKKYFPMDRYTVVTLMPENRCHSACNIDPLSRGIGVQN